MKLKNILLLCVIISTQVNAQSTLKPFNSKDVQAFAEFSPFLAGFQLVSISAGVEFNKWQMGASFSKGTHHFTHGLSKTTFANFRNLHFLHNQSEEIFVKRYFKADRSNFYVGALFNLTHWEAQNEAQKVYVNTVGRYFTIYGGYRWFPYKKKNNIFYIEPNFGISTRLNDNSVTQVGDQSFSYLRPPFELTPNVLAGARFNLMRKKK
jgi:hypothetical protein